MGLDNPLHIAFLLVIILLVFGAKRLPEMGRSLGAGMREFKDSITGSSHDEPAAPLTPPPPAASEPTVTPAAAPAETPAAAPTERPAAAPTEREPASSS
ncbi:MAG: Sec-independent protein translocase subunit TatA/TatB [Solirubrobacteraceae bacterium]|nr:MAG: twin-arginine translocase TatA/TatE family subunit [Solirubrobacterales bacterium]